MGKYGAPTQKPHVGYANFASVGRLNLGQMTKAEIHNMKQKKIQTTKVYKNKAGRKCWCGTKHLKRSQSEAQFTCMGPCMVCSSQQLDV